MAIRAEILAWLRRRRERARRIEAVEKYHAIEGGRQTLHHLAAYVAEILRKGVEG